MNPSFTEKIFSLYSGKDIDRILAQKYSRFKFGDPQIIDIFANDLSKLIADKCFLDRKCVLYTTNKFPTREIYKKNSLILSEKISEILGLPLILGEYDYVYESDSFYDNHKKRKAHVPKISNEDKSKYDSYNFIMIDDSIFSGTTFNTSVGVLCGVAREVLMFSVLDLRKSKYSEKEVNDLCLVSDRIKFLEDILHSNKYVITTHMLRTIGKLDRAEISSIIKGLDKNNKHRLIDSYKFYTGENLLF